MKMPMLRYDVKKVDVSHLPSQKTSYPKTTNVLVLVQHGVAADCIKVSAYQKSKQS
jgi:hypothetical protein